MFRSIGKYTRTGLSAAGSAFMFVLMLPLAFAALIIMIVAGGIALVNYRQRLRDGVAASWRSSEVTGGADVCQSVKPPIEGQYTIVQD